MPNCGLNMSDQMTPAMTGAIISGMISTFSKILPTRLERLRRSAMPMPRMVSMPVAATAYRTVVPTERQKSGSDRTLMKFETPTNWGLRSVALKLRNV